MRSAIAKAAGLTDVGLKRDGNEDSFSIDMKLGLFVVADGMGGHLAGEVASRVAVDLINKSFKKWADSNATEEDLFEYPDPSLSRFGNYVLSSIRFANRVIHEMATEHKDYSGMGTTVAVLAVMPDLIITANVGDSRIYLVRKGQIEQLSRDHSIVAEQLEMGIMTDEEAEQSPLKHVLTRNLGSAKFLDAEVFEIEPASKDRFILCSDGLTDLVSDDEIHLRSEIYNPDIVIVLDESIMDMVDVLKGLKKDGDISEDDAFRAQDQVQKITDEHIKLIDDISKEKEKEILEF